MRVGIHTGTVLCGIVGTVRFKFDVWSNDVTLANIMESTGEPGKVHISEATREFLVNDYEMVEGEEVPGREMFSPDLFVGFFFFLFLPKFFLEHVLFCVFLLLLAFTF